MNKHCDWIPIEIVYDLMEKLQIKRKQDFAELAGVTRRQLRNWEMKGRVPRYRLSTLREAVHLKAKERYDEIVRILYEE